MTERQPRLSVILGDNINNEKTKEELLEELEEMEVKLNQAGMVGLELYNENESLHVKASEMVEQITHDEELIEMLRSEVTQYAFERDRLKAAVADYADKLKSSDADHRALSDKILYQEKNVKEMTESRENLSRKVRSLEQTLQYVHETYGEKHDEHNGMNAKQTERELEKIEKEKRSLMMKELIYAQKERMYKHEIKTLRKKYDDAINDKNNSEKSAIILRERSETLSHKLNKSLDEIQEAQSENIVLASNNFKLQNELKEIKALHEEHKANSPKHPTHRNSIFDHAPRSVMPRTNTLLALYSMVEEEDDETERQMKDIEKKHETKILKSKKKHLDHLHSKSQLHGDTNSDRKHQEKIKNRINQVNNQLEENLKKSDDEAMADDFVVVDDDYDDNDLDENNKKEAGKNVVVDDGIKTFFKKLSMRNLHNKIENRNTNSNRDDMIAANNLLLEKARNDIKELEKKLDLKSKEVNSLSNSKETLNSLLNQAQDETVDMENDLRFAMRELENIKQLKETVDQNLQKLNKDLEVCRTENVLLKDKEAVSSVAIESSKITIDSLNEEIKKYKLNEEKLSKDNEASQLIGDKMMQLQADIIVLQEQKDQEIRANAKLKADIMELKEKSTNTTSVVTKEVNNLKNENTKLSNLILEKNKLIEQANLSILKEKQYNTEQLNVVKIALNDKKQELRMAKESILKLTDDVNIFKDEIEAVKKKHFVQQSASSNHVQTIEELNSTIEELNSTIEDKNIKLEARKKSIARMANELSTLRKENDELREKFESTMELYNAQVLVANSLKTKMENNDSAASRYNELKIKYDISEGNNKSLELKLKDSAMHINELTNELNHIEKNLDSTESNAAKTTEKIFKLDEKIKRLERTKVNFEKVIREKNQKLQMYKEESIEETQALTKALDDLKIVDIENEKLKTSISNLETELKEKNKQIAEFNKKDNATELKNKVDIMKHEIEHLTKEAKHLKTELKNSKDIMSKEVEHLSRKESKIKLFLKNAEDNLENTSSKLEDAIEEKRSLKQRLDNMKMEYMQLENKYKKLENELVYEDRKDDKTEQHYKASIQDLNIKLLKAKEQTVKIMDLYHELEIKYKASEMKLKNFNIMTGDSNKSTNNANSLDDIGTVVDDTDDYDAWADEDDGHMKKVDKKIIQLEVTLTKKLNIKRNKVLKALDIICRGVGVDKLKKTLVGGKIKSAIGQYNEMKQKVLLRHKSSQIELNALNDINDRIYLLEKLIAKETEDLERCIWLIEHLAAPITKGGSNTNTFRQNVLRNNGKMLRQKERKKKKAVVKKRGYHFRHLNEEHEA